METAHAPHNAPDVLLESYMALLDKKNQIADAIASNSARHSIAFVEKALSALDAKIYAAHLAVINKNIEGINALKNDMALLATKYQQIFPAKQQCE